MNVWFNKSKEKKGLQEVFEFLTSNKIVGLKHLEEWQHEKSSDIKKNKSKKEALFKLNDFLHEYSARQERKKQAAAAGDDNDNKEQFSEPDSGFF